MPAIIRDYQEGEEIADAVGDRRYTFDELDNAMFVCSTSTEGYEVYLLNNGKYAILQSIDLDYIEPWADLRLLTASHTNQQEQS